MAEAGGVRIGVIHDAGPATRRLERMRPALPGCRPRSCSATRTSRCTRRPRDGFQIFNPGSPTDRRRQPRHTMGIATVRDGRVYFEHVFLD